MIHWLPFINGHLAKICSVCKSDTKRCIEFQDGGWNHKIVCQTCIEAMAAKLEKKP